MSFKNEIQGSFTLVKEGNSYCGFSAEPEEIRYDIEVESDDLDSNGFVVDVGAVKDRISWYLHEHPTSESGEEIAKWIVKKVKRLMRTAPKRIAVTIHSTTWSKLTYTIGDDPKARIAELEAELAALKAKPKALSREESDSLLEHLQVKVLVPA